MTEKYTNTDYFFRQHDYIAGKINQLNAATGKKFMNRWTYDKLAHNAAKALNIPFKDAYSIPIDKLIEFAN